MNEEPVRRSQTREAGSPVEDVETAIADLRWALDEEDTVEKHYHVRSAMQRLHLLVERADRR